MSSESAIIPLGQMPQQAGIRNQKDDWTGIVDRTERRRLQNRLNQRAYRTEILLVWWCLGDTLLMCNRSATTTQTKSKSNRGSGGLRYAICDTYEFK